MKKDISPEFSGSTIADTVPKLVTLIVPEQLKNKFKEHFASIQKLKAQMASIEALLTESANSFIMGKLDREITDEVFAFNKDFDLVQQPSKTTA